MISRQTGQVQLFQQFDAFIRIGSITDHVAKTPNLVRIGLGAQNRFERVEIRVDVGDYEDGQRRRPSV